MARTMVCCEQITVLLLHLAQKRCGIEATADLSCFLNVSCLYSTTHSWYQQPVFPIEQFISPFVLCTWLACISLKISLLIGF